MTFDFAVTNWELHIKSITRFTSYYRQPHQSFFFAPLTFFSFDSLPFLLYLPNFSTTPSASILLFVHYYALIHPSLTLKATLTSNKPLQIPSTRKAFATLRKWPPPLPLSSRTSPQPPKPRSMSLPIPSPPKLRHFFPQLTKLFSLRISTPTKHSCSRFSKQSSISKNMPL